MIKSLILTRSAATTAFKGSSQVSVPRRPLKKIRLGKARPAIYHQFEAQVEMSDGSVIKRVSQFPKNELRLIQDQRNNPLWNPSRDDLVVVDANAGGSLDKFKQKYSSIFLVEESTASESAATAAAVTDGEPRATTKKFAEKKAETSEEDAAFEMQDYLSLLDDSTQQIKSGKLATKKKVKK